MSNQENNLKETKKTRRRKTQRKAQQIKLAVIMIMVSVLVLSASTFAWYRMSKIASIQTMEFTADTLGNLLISDSENGTYKSTLDLGLGRNKAILLPATTKDGIVFLKPDYTDDGMKVEGVLAMEDGNILDGTEMQQEGYTDDGKEHYVYKKVFYIKSGVNQDDSKIYNLKLVNGGNKNDKGAFTTGTFLNDNGDDSTFDSLNAVRVSFVIDSTANIFVPFNTGNGETAGTFAEIDTNAFTDYQDYNAYDITLEQDEDGEFDDVTLCQISEGTPVEITMYVWFEGMDEDCENEIALDTLSGQIQFEAEETTQAP